MYGKFVSVFRLLFTSSCKLPIACCHCNLSFVVFWRPFAKSGPNLLLGTMPFNFLEKLYLKYFVQIPIVHVSLINVYCNWKKWLFFLFSVPACVVAGVTYTSGSKVPQADGCNECDCSNGELISCTTHTCSTYCI